MTTIYQKIGAIIRYKRIELGLSQQKLAKLSNISRGSISNIESGRQKLQIHTLIEIAQALGLSASELVRD
jgi:transcriptional regulator with XRE-family HTH domain